jgi:hypothetical protein
MEVWAMVLSSQWLALLWGNDRSLLLGKEDLGCTQHNVSRGTTAALREDDWYMRHMSRLFRANISEFIIPAIGE